MNIKDILSWHTLLRKADDASAEETNHGHFHSTSGFSRRGFIRTAGLAGAAGISLGAGLSNPAFAQKRNLTKKDHLADDDDDNDNDDRDGDADDKASALPIPGGTVLPFSTERYHFFFPPGTNNGIVNLPPTPGVVEPSLITDFSGFVGLAHVKGAGTGVNTETGATSRFFFDTDTRFMKGKYIGMCDHKQHAGAFAFI
jgi:hypothetical protein